MFTVQLVIVIPETKHRHFVVKIKTSNERGIVFVIVNNKYNIGSVTNISDNYPNSKHLQSIIEHQL